MQSGIVLALAEHAGCGGKGHSEIPMVSRIARYLLETVGSILAVGVVPSTGLPQSPFERAPADESERIAEDIPRRNPRKVPNPRPSHRDSLAIRIRPFRSTAWRSLVVREDVIGRFHLSAADVQ